MDDYDRHHVSKISRLDHHGVLVVDFLPGRRLLLFHETIDYPFSRALDVVDDRCADGGVASLYKLLEILSLCLLLWFDVHCNQMKLSLLCHACTCVMAQLLSWREQHDDEMAP